MSSLEHLGQIREQITGDQAPLNFLRYLARSVLQQKKDFFAEKSYIARLRLAVDNEIPLIVDWPLDDKPEEAVAIKVAHFEALKKDELVVFVVAQKQWMEKTYKSCSEEMFEVLYQHLKNALKLVDKMRGQNLSIVSREELLAKIPPLRAPLQK